MSTAPKTKAARIQITFKAVPKLAVDDPIIEADNPRPSWLLTATEGRGEAIGTWEVWHPHHLIGEDYEALTASGAAIVAAPKEGEPLARLRNMLSYGVPEMPKDLYKRLSPHQLQVIEGKIWTDPYETPEEAKERKADAANPSGGAGTSASSSPAPLVASAGRTTT